MPLDSSAVEKIVREVMTQRIGAAKPISDAVNDPNMSPVAKLSLPARARAAVLVEKNDWS
jgi:hypothetical protein